MEGAPVLHPEIGYDVTADFQSFLAEAENLRHWGQTWHTARDQRAAVTARGLAASGELGTADASSRLA